MPHTRVCPTCACVVEVLWEVGQQSNEAAAMEHIGTNIFMGKNVAVQRERRAASADRRL